MTDRETLIVYFGAHKNKHTHQKIHREPNNHNHNHNNINKHRDLPLNMNQWAKVFCWEPHMRPFLFMSKFHWQEGHTAHTDAEEMPAKACNMMEVYGDLCYETLTLPIMRGIKLLYKFFVSSTRPTPTVTLPASVCLASTFLVSHLITTKTQ